MTTTLMHVARADLIHLGDKVEYKHLEDSLFEAAAASTAITVLGGYYNADWLLRLLKKVPKAGRKTCKVRIAVGMESVALIPRTWADMKRLADNLRKAGFRDVEIAAVSNSPAHFHTKLYHFLNKTRPIWFVGSANPGTIRHELMISIPGKHVALADYVKAVFKVAIPINGPRPKIRISTLQDFFLSGYLLHKRPQQRPYTFDAFRFRPEDRERMAMALAGGVGVEHARPATQGFGFSLRSAMGLDEVLIESDDDPQRVQTRPLSVDTVFGLWMPAPYADWIRRQVTDEESDRHERLVSFSAALEAAGGAERVQTAFSAYVQSMERFLKEHKMEAIPVTDREGTFQRFLTSRRRLLSDPASRDHQSRIVTIEPMPNIWDDVRAAEAFEYSFFEDLAYRLDQPSSSKKGKLVRSIAKALDLDAGIDAVELRGQLAGRLATASWSDSDWQQL